MRWLTLKAILNCKHQMGLVGNQASQKWVKISSSPVLVATDPEGRPIAGCPNVGATIKPCTTTLKVTKGYCSWIKIDGHKVCLDTVTELTDGTPPGTVKYEVRSPGQLWVEAK